MKISFIGYGNMAKAMAQGLVNQKNYTLTAAAPSLPEGVNQLGICTFSDNKKAIKDADVIILAVKPAQMETVLKEIIPHLPNNVLLITIAAGLSLSWFANYLPAQQALIRSMPNTPAAVGLAATPLCANSLCTAEQKQAAEHIFSSFGICTWINKEEHLDSFTALSGSGPAYVFLFLEAMTQAGVAMGLDEKVAESFALQTIKGSCALAEKSPLKVKELRKKVTSPGGTTAAALQVLEGKLEALMLQSLQAAKQRAKELGS
ncbi:MAG: pyrroline-5-carboxylate reductase [Legionella sp.]|nr:MAG: pyrroline-5-carboxylate reductase [Legionella sp.]